MSATRTTISSIGTATHRLDDLDRFAELGIRALRYPVLWERTAPDGCARFAWADARLGRLRDLGVRPIVGLVHHGSGPPRTSLLDPSFAEGLARFARAVAERYPWVEDYTPVNEPLTTAHFSGLYGHWYPHGRDGRAFVRALLTQCRAIAAAMCAVREINPRARLVQTEDLGRTFSTLLLAYQAQHENHRHRGAPGRLPRGAAPLAGRGVPRGGGRARGGRGRAGDDRVGAARLIRLGQPRRARSRALRAGRLSAARRARPRRAAPPVQRAR